MDKNEIAVKLKNLPDHLIPEVLDYIEFLLSKYGSKKTERKAKKSKFRFDWEGGLSELKDQYSSVELQHKALEWR